MRQGKIFRAGNINSRYDFEGEKRIRAGTEGVSFRWGRISRASDSMNGFG